MLVNEAPHDLVLAPGCVVRLLEVAAPPSELAAAFQELCDNIPWATETDDFGPQQRLSYYCGDKDCTFGYVGLSLVPKPWPKRALALRDLVAKATGIPAAMLTGCLMNRYRVGAGSISWHPDTVRAHGERKIVAALSLGSTRLFRVRRRDGTGEDVEIEVKAGDCVLMEGDAQDIFEHELPLRPDDGERISLTFRSIVPGFEDALSGCKTVS